MIQALYSLGDLDNAQENIEELLEVQENNEFGILYLSKIFKDKGDLEKEKNALEKLLDISRPEGQIEAARRLKIVNKKIEERKSKELKMEELKVKYNTEEERKKFIGEIYEVFNAGEIGVIGIRKKIKEAKNYLNFHKSLIVLLDIEAKITGDKGRKVEELEKLIGKYPIGTGPYNEIYNAIIETIESIEVDEMLNREYDKQLARERKEEEEEKRKRKELAKEQRKYSKEVVDKLRKGEITQEELPEIVQELEKFSDASKSIFLISVLYESLYDKETAYKALAKYTEIAGLTPKEKENIANMYQKLATKEEESPSIKKIKGIYKEKEMKLLKQKEKDENNKIRELLARGMTAIQICEQLNVGNEVVNENEERNMMNKIHRIMGQNNINEWKTEGEPKTVKYVEDFLECGYTPKQVYKIIGGNFSIEKIRNIRRLHNNKRYIETKKEDMTK